MTILEIILNWFFPVSVYAILIMAIFMFVIDIIPVDAIIQQQQSVSCDDDVYDLCATAKNMCSREILKMHL